MSLVSSKIKTFIKSRKLNVFLIFFLLAFFILILTRLSSNYTSTVKFKVQLENIPEEMIVINDSLNTLNLTMSTHGFGWMKYYLKTPSVVIDFKNEVKERDSLYIWSLSRGYAGINKQFGKDIDLKTINPDSLFFKVDVNAVKIIPVLPNIEINYSPGYNVLKDIITTPDSVKVIGPQSLLNTLTSIETEPLSKNNISKPFSAKLKLKTGVLDSQIKIKNKTVSVNIETEKFTEGTFSLPISIINVPNNLEVNFFPKTINLSFYTSLERYNSIKKTDFEVIYDFNEHDSKSSYLSPKLVKSPKTIKSSRLHQQKIEYIISE
ncbi:MAG: YbbR-like domain-containing protein [Lacinutrix sp.]|uniref:CdaR family protein n=1 Tax=Lacinutrix sp. TaxID=1937692 RepID=UPI0030A1D3E5